MHYFALHIWSKYPIILTTVWWVTTQKQPKKLLSAGMKKFEIWKLRNNYKSDVNETYMTCVPPQQLSFAKTWGCESKGGWRCIQKSTKKWWEINKISTLTSPKNSLQNDLKVGTFFHVFLNNLTLVLPKMEDGGVWLLMPLPSAHIGGGGSACC